MKTRIIALAFLTHAQAQVFLLPEGMKGDCASLAKALEDGKIAGAGLDVVDPEPQSKDHPLWKMKNVIITPPVAGVSEAKSES
jgi:phosphoglycerate dehydrogenase-like enzyme